MGITDTCTSVTSFYVNSRAPDSGWPACEARAFAFRVRVIFQAQALTFFFSHCLITEFGQLLREF